MNLAALFSIFLFMLIALKILKRPKKSESPPNLPPGPKKLPIIGNIHNLVGSLPHHGLRDLSRKYGPLMHLQLGEVSTVIVSSAEFAKEITKTHDLIFATRPPILASTILSYDNKGLTFAPYGDYWIQMRKICALELFSLKRVQSLWPIREEEFSDLIRRIASKEGSVINLTREIVQSISAITARSAFGRKCKDNDEFLKVVKEALAVAAGFNIGDLFPSVKWLQNMSGLKGKLEKLHQRVDGIMENIINEHKVAKSRAMEGLGKSEEDLIDVLLKFQENNHLGFQLSNDNIKAVILDVFGGGSETLTTTIAWAMAEMIKDVRSLKKAQAEVRQVFNRRGKADESGIDELKYLKLVVKETLRLHSPGPLLLPRECSQAIEIKGYHIPLKSKIIINAWAIGRDQNYWTEPERFYPERFIDSSFDYNGTHLEYIPFGAGRRICPGMAFGLANIELGLALLLYHFDWKLPKGVRNEDLDMTEAFGIAVIRKNDLNLIPITYAALPVRIS